MSRDYPHLLVATEFAPNASGGGPAVVRQLLAGWPAERLHWWSCRPEIDRRFGQKVASHHLAKIPAKLYPQQRLARLKAGLLCEGWAPWAGRQLSTTLNLVRPDAVWVIPHLWSALPISRALTQSGRAYHISIHDFVDAHGLRERVGHRASQSLVQAEDDLYAAARSRDVIADSMIEEMHLRTGKGEATVRRAGVQPADFAFLENKQTHPSTAIRIAYAGSIIAQREFALFVQALGNARPRLSRPVELHLFGAHPFRANSWFDGTWMREFGNLTEEKLLSALRECDWGFSPMELTDTNARYNQFSFPTKFVSYLAAGLPVISLGHPKSTLVRMAAKYHLGLCAQTQDVQALSAALETLLADVQPWQIYGAEIIRCARAEFDGAKMRASLKECLREQVQPTAGTEI